MLKGTGTLASKSRLTEEGESSLECLSSRYENESKGRQEETLASGGGGWERGKGEEEGIDFFTMTQCIDTANPLNILMIENYFEGQLVLLEMMK